MSSDPFLNKQLGSYLVQARLGEGGMARVYKAYHPRLRRDVAIKIILPQVAERAGFRTRFEREGQLIANLDHPNIVRVYDIGEDEGLTYLVMQFVSGGTLRDQVRGNKPMSPPQAIAYAVQMARALHHAHQRGIVHRDVKPQNMLISGTDRRQILLSDFGIAKMYSDAEINQDLAATAIRDQETSVTSLDQIIGTAEYMAPEQARGDPVDARTDVYAMGVVLFQMLTGDVPFHSTTVPGLLYQQVYTQPPSVSTINPRIPDALAQIVARAMAKAPDERFQSAEILARALELANLSATNPLDSQAQQSLYALLHDMPSVVPPPPSTDFTRTFPQSYTTIDDRGRTQSGSMARQPITGPASGTEFSRPQIGPGQLDRTNTFPNPGRSDRTNTFPNPGVHLPNTGVEAGPLTYPSYPYAGPDKRQLPIGYVLVALLLVLGLAGFGAYKYFSASQNPGQSSQYATPFTDNFSSNALQWEVGNLADGVTAQVGDNEYLLTTTQNYTSFPYPMGIKPLAANFTYTATIKQTYGSSSMFFGIAFRFSTTNGTIKCLALIINQNGKYQIQEVNQTQQYPLFSGQYTTSTTSGPHVYTLSVTGTGDHYTFRVDGQKLNTSTSSKTLVNSDFTGGGLALYITGPTQSSQYGQFVVTSVQLN